MNHDYKYEGMNEEHRNALIPALGHKEQREERARARDAQGHTPGPWQLGHQTSGGFTVVRDIANESHNNSGKWEVLATCQPGAWWYDRQITEAEARANARLIAAAPDLLAQCKAAEEWLFDWIEKDCNPPLEDACDTRDAIRAAIAKAEGRHNEA